MDKRAENYTIEELLEQIETMKKTIAIQHATITRLMNTYVLKKKQKKNQKANAQMVQ